MSGRHSVSATQIETPKMIVRRVQVCVSLIMPTAASGSRAAMENKGLKKTPALWMYLDNYRRDANTLNR